MHGLRKNAAGEVAAGLHGANRLGGNSLSDLIVFGKRAGQYAAGRKQFEGYQTVDSNDVENAVWRFLCMAHSDGVAAARDDLLKIKHDRRVPMMEIYAMFAGRTTPDQVLVTTGAQQALDLLLRCEVAPGHPVLTEDPTYPGFIDALHRSGARPVGVETGHVGEHDKLRRAERDRDRGGRGVGVHVEDLAVRAPRDAGDDGNAHVGEQGPDRAGIHGCDVADPVPHEGHGCTQRVPRPGSRWVSCRTCGLGHQETGHWAARPGVQPGPCPLARRLPAGGAAAQPGRARRDGDHRRP